MISLLLKYTRKIDLKTTEVWKNMKIDKSGRREFLKKSGVLFGVFASIAGSLKAGKLIYSTRKNSDSAFVPRDAQDKISS